MAAVDLGLSLVDNPVAAGGAYADGDEQPPPLAVLPDQLRRVGDLLSAPDGSPTWLYKAAFVVLVCWPVSLMLGSVPPFPSAFVALADGDVAMAVIVLGIGLSFLLAGPVALHTLRLVTRRAGPLAQLGVGKAEVPQTRLDALQSSARWLRCFGAAFQLLFAALCLTYASSSGTVLSALAMACFDVPFIAASFLWWFSVKVAATLTDAPVADARARARAEASRLRESGEAMDAERWRSEVEEPVWLLGRTTMPLISDGWGPSVGLVGGAWVLATLSFITLDVSEGMFSKAAAGDVSAAVLLALTVGIATVPFFLAMDPAAVSSKCARLEDDINALCGEDTSFAPSMHFLKHLKALNKDQGLGFVVFGQVVSKRTLCLTASTIYSVVVLFAPTLLQELGLEAACGAGGGKVGECPFGWTFADDTCFQLFGDKPICMDVANNCCASVPDGEPAVCARGYEIVGEQPQSYGTCYDSQGNRQPNYACEWTGPPRTVAEEIKARMSEPLAWAEAEEACMQMGEDTHLASVTSAAQQAVAARLAAATRQQVWYALT